ncbi:MAG: HAMP domain-containing protein [Chloroflexi bacterium]|nr:HAMP domain-containing protein [Chloroflexota bacterium]
MAPRVGGLESSPPSGPVGGALPRRRGGLFHKYVVLIASLVGVTLIGGGVLEGYFSYQEHHAHLVAIQEEKASTAAGKIEQFIGEVDHLLTAVVRAPRLAETISPEQRRSDYLRLLRQAPAISEVSYIDAAGREREHVSRTEMDVAQSGLDRSREPLFVQTRGGRFYHGPVYFRNESEPHMSIALADDGPDPGVTAAELNLKLVWDIVSRIQVGQAGRAYVVDRNGQLIADPDISLVLRKTDLSGLPQVAAARTAPARSEEAQQAAVAHDLRGQPVLAAYDTVDPPGWIVFVEQPLGEALAPLYSFVLRTTLILLVALTLAAAVSLVLARRMVRPIRVLQHGAAAIASGALHQQIQVQTGDELEELAEQFNHMTAELRESYSTLEQRVQQRTNELAELNQTLAELNHTLEDRVREQVDELERVGRLRRYLAPQLAELIVSSGDESMLKSHRARITVVFCDLRGFTSFSETSEPEEMMGVLDQYHAALGEAIRRFEGTIAFFAGDGVMVFFNDPLPQSDHTERAVRMAMLLRERISGLAVGWRRHGHILGFGIGVALGYATVGRIGFEGRFEYTAIGSVVNLSARLCAEAVDGQILISESAFGTVEDLVETEQLGELLLKGIHRPVPALNVIGMRKAPLHSFTEPTA